MFHLTFYILSSLLLLCKLHKFAGAQGLGVTYARIADNLPSAQGAITKIENCNLKRVRLYDPSHDALDALRRTAIQVIVGVTNDDVVKMAFSPEVATNWVKTNIVPYASDVEFRCIAVGYKLLPSHQYAHAALFAMQHLQAALQENNLQNIPISIEIELNALSVSYPPSAGTFDPPCVSLVKPIAEFLLNNHYPILCNLWPYYAYLGDGIYNNISLDYALLDTPTVIVQDGDLGYSNMFDALVDAFYAALEKIGVKFIKVIVSETGWPSKSGPSIATAQNAETYYLNLALHAKQFKGTPKHPTWPVEVYLHTLFQQNKERPDRQNIGLFTPNMNEVFPLFSLLSSNY